jgi:hypothetical protein
VTNPENDDFCEYRCSECTGECEGHVGSPSGDADPISESEADDFIKLLLNAPTAAPVEPSAERRQLSSAFTTAASAMFEMYESYIKAGFSASQSLEICIAVLTASLK